MPGYPQNQNQSARRFTPQAPSTGKPTWKVLDYLGTIPKNKSAEMRIEHIEMTPPGVNKLPQHYIRFSMWQIDPNTSQLAPTKNTILMRWDLKQNFLDILSGLPDDPTQPITPNASAVADEEEEEVF